jgi:hypothetical protein
MGSKGVSKYDNIFKVNQIYGKWLIVDEKIFIDGEAKVLCRCLECNQTEKYVPAYQLVTGVSKRCSVCGCIDDDNRQSQETFKCIECGYENNADVNAAINITIKPTKTERTPIPQLR